MSLPFSNLLDAALRYADLGYPVFPCAPASKRPLTENGFHDATTDSEQIERWWTQRPNANVAIATQGLLVLDIDAKSTWLADNPERAMELAVAPLSLTANGGRHYVFRQPPGRGWRNTTGALAKGVDTRADGGYVVVPPSALPGGKAYRWAEGLELDVPPDRLPEPPAWLVEQLDTLAARGPTLAHVAAGETSANQIPSGQRNATLARLGGTMRRVGMSGSEILAALSRANADRCTPPLDEREVERIAESVARYQPDQVSVALVEDHWGQMGEAPERTDGPADPGPFPEHLLDVPGFVGEVMAYNLATAFKPQPVLALGGALCLQATLAARRVRDQLGNRTNLYVVGVSPSGTGKDHARKVNRNILVQAGLDALEGNEDIASDAGLVGAVELEPAILFQLDEFGRFLRTIGNPQKAPHLYNVLTTLMKLYSSADTVFRGKAYADAKRNKFIDQPCVSLYATTVEEHLYQSLTAESLSDGFVARLMVFEVSTQVKRRRAPQRPIPEAILDTARWWGDFRPGGNLRHEHPEPQVVENAHEAECMFDKLAELVDKQLEKKDAVGQSLWSRAEEKACRLALVYACSAHAQQPVVDEAAARWACDLSEYQTRRMLFLASQWVADGQFDAKQKRLIRALRSAGGTLSQSELYNKTRSLTPRQRQEIIDNLLQTGQVEVQTVKTATKPKVTYVLR